MVWRTSRGRDGDLRRMVCPPASCIRITNRVELEFTSASGRKRTFEWSTLSLPREKRLYGVTVGLRFSILAVERRRLEKELGALVGTCGYHVRRVARIFAKGRAVGLSTALQYLLHARPFARAPEPVDNLDFFSGEAPRGTRELPAHIDRQLRSLRPIQARRVWSGHRLW